MIGRMLVLGIFLVFPATVFGDNTAHRDGTQQAGQISQYSQTNRPSVHRPSAKPRVNERAADFSPLADLKAEISKLEPVQTILDKRDSRFNVKVTCLIRNVGNKPSTPTVARIVLESVSRTTSQRTLQKPIKVLNPGENGYISWQVPMYGDRLQIRPKLNVRFYWRCEADPLPHERGKFKRNNSVRKYISVKAAYD